MPVAEDAPFNAYPKQHESNCLKGTRVDLLKEIHDWADGQDKPCIFWLKGLAGTGKSTIARTVARSHLERKCLGASFFFSRGGGDVSHAGKFVTTIARQLADNVPTLRQHICDAVAERSGIASQSLRDQWHHLVLCPLSKLDGNGCRTPYVLVVDALDECDDDNNIQIVIQLLAEARSLEKVRLRVFLTSRPEIPIQRGFRDVPDTQHEDFVLHYISPSIVDSDISIFLEYHLGCIGQDEGLGAGWPGPDAIRTLVKSASGLFIWAATARCFILRGLFADESLDIILHGGASATAATPEEHLDGIYVTVLQNSVGQSFSEQERDKFYTMLRGILGSIVTAASPLYVESFMSQPTLHPRTITSDNHRILSEVLETSQVPLSNHQNLKVKTHHFGKLNLFVKICDPRLYDL